MGGTRAAWAVVDLGFGDAGKGLMTDYLVRRTGADVVVRFNGGSQAAHNVICPDGRHHTFSQFGSGSFVGGVKTILSRYVAVHPTALLIEGEVLRQKGLADIFSRVIVSSEAPLITPYHQAAGRLRELARGTDRHGSCGVGFGETVRDGLTAPGDALLAGDLLDRTRLRKKLLGARERLWRDVQSFLPPNHSSRAAARERAVFERRTILEDWMNEAVRLAGLGIVAPESKLAQWMRKASGLVFEGAQGVLLDECAGFHPFTTWSRCTFDNAAAIASETNPELPLRRMGVTRAYGVRHGPGPLPTEDKTLNPAVTEHNRSGTWQGDVRYGWFDAVLMRYALDAAGPVDALALTHLDTPARMSQWKLAESYAVAGDHHGELVSKRTAGGAICGITAPDAPTLERQSKLTHLLFSAAPNYHPCPASQESVIQSVEQLLSRKVDVISRGPTASDVLWRD